MPFHVHCIVKHAANANEARRHRPVKQKMPRLSHARRGSNACPAVAKVAGADAIPDFGPRGAAGAKPIDGDIAKANGEERFVAKAGRLSKGLMSSPEDGDDVLLGECRQPDRRQGYAPDFAASLALLPRAAI